MYHKFIRITDSRPIILTAVGKKELEESSRKKQYHYQGQCDENGVLVADQKEKAEQPEIKTTLTTAENNDSKKSVEEIFNSTLKENLDQKEKAE